MNKEQQIEEMAVIGCVRNPQAHTAEECAKCDFKNGQCNSYRHAEAIYNAGYRKISEDNICEALEKPVDTSKRKYESIDGIVRGFVVKDGKILYVTNILDGCRHEFKDIHEICDELNNNMKKIDRLMELNNHLRFQLDELKGV